VKGLNDMLAILKAISKKFPDRVAQAIYLEGQIAMTEAKRRCPVAPDGGTLRASGMVHQPVRTLRHIAVTLSFGGAAQDYAIAVHEHPSEHSPPSWVIAEARGSGIHWNADGTGPKFLEGPINELQPILASKLAARLQLDKE